MLLSRSLTAAGRLTRESAHVHLLEGLALEDADGELAGVGHVAQREADLAQVHGLVVVVGRRPHVPPLLHHLAQVHAAQRHVQLADLVVLGEAVEVEDLEAERLLADVRVLDLLEDEGLVVDGAQRLAVHLQHRACKISINYYH